MADKMYDCAVKVGSYESNGETKNRYLNIGAIVSGEHGPYMLMEKTFNPAGVAGQEGRGSIMVSLFKPRDRNDAQPIENPAPAQQTSDFDGIPF